MASASLKLRNGIWHLVWRYRGLPKGRTTKIEHDGKTLPNGKPKPPAAVMRALYKLKEELEQGRGPTNKKLTDLLDEVEKEYGRAKFKSTAALKSRLTHLRAWFGNLRAEQIRIQDFREYLDHRQEEGAADATIKRELEVIRKALKLGELAVPPMPTLTLAKPRQGFFDDAKIASVCKFLPEYLRAPFLFGYYTGWRREEVFGLEWKDVDFEAGEIRLAGEDSKNGEGRVFLMDAVPALRPLLDELKAKRIQPTEGSVVVHITPWVFTHTRKETGSVQRIVDFRKALATACTKAGCPGMIFHDLRRSAARNLEMAGWSRSLIMEWMGHKSEAMFHRYRIVSKADRDIVKKKIAERKAAQQ